MNPVATPAATYRVQFNKSFRFVDARDLIPYLSDLGITDMYSSPRYKARRGSSHCYDIANPLRVNSELGAEEDFDEMAVGGLALMYPAFRWSVVRERSQISLATLSYCFARRIDTS